VTFLELTTRTLRRSDEDPTTPAAYTVAQAKAAINEGLLLMGLLTLYVERTVSFPVTSGVGLYRMLLTYSDWLAPLRIEQAGVKVKPARLVDLAARDLSWRLASGAVTRYAHIGFDLLAFYKRPVEGNLDITYVACPTPLVADGDVPELPDEVHPLLVKFGIYRLRYELGGQDFNEGLTGFADFIAGAIKLGDAVRVKSVGLGYDLYPIELRQFDVPKLKPAKVGTDGN
jgi:hypothetical protein